jgi:hypothetical protein
MSHLAVAAAGLMHRYSLEETEHEKHPADDRGIAIVVTGFGSGGRETVHA